MKKFITSLALMVGLVSISNAQFFSGPNTGPALLIAAGTNYTISGKFTTNLAAATVFNIPVGKNGIGFSIHSTTSGAGGTTNATIRLESSVDGTLWHTGKTNVILSFPQNGTTTHLWYTNVQSTSVNLGNQRYLRIASIQNTNSETLYITNITWSITQ